MFGLSKDVTAEGGGGSEVGSGGGGEMEETSWCCRAVWLGPWRAIRNCSSGLCIVDSINSTESDAAAAGVGVGGLLLLLLFFGCLSFNTGGAGGGAVSMTVCNALKMLL